MFHTVVADKEQDLTNSLSDALITVASSTKIFNNVVLGYGVVCDQDSIIDTECFIDKLVMIGKNTKILTQTTIRYATRIGNNVVINNNVTIGNHVTIEDDCVIGEECNIGHQAILNAGVILSDSLYVPPKVILFSGIYLDQESVNAAVEDFLEKYGEPMSPLEILEGTQ